MAGSMKILLLNQTFYPDRVATSQQLTDLADFLVSQGNEVSVLAGRRGYEDRDKVFPQFETFKGVKIFRVQSTGFGKQRFILRVFDALTFNLALAWKLVFFPRQDVVVSFTSPPLIGILGSLFCFFKGGKGVQWLMDINPEAAFAVGYINRTSLVGRFLNWVFDLTLKASEHIVVLDRWMKKVVVEHGAEEERVSIIHPWSLFDPTTELKQSQDSVFREQNNLRNKTVIMYSGNHSVVHPLYTLMAAAKQLRDDPSIVFAFVGGGLRSLEVADFKEKEGLDNIVQMPLIPREQLADVLCGIDAHVVVMGEAVNGLVHTSKVYGVLATGRPIIYISPKQSHLTDVLQKCQHTYHAEHGEVEKVVAAIKKIQKLSVSEKEETARENKTFFRNQFSRNRCFAIFSEEVLKVPQTKGVLGHEDMASSYSQ